MNSRPGMPLKVSSTPTTSMLLSSVIPNDVRDSNVMSESSSSVPNASPAFRGGAAVGGVRPIVVNAVETQNSPEGGPTFTHDASGRPSKCVLGEL